MTWFTNPRYKTFSAVAKPLHIEFTVSLRCGHPYPVSFATMQISRRTALSIGAASALALPTYFFANRTAAANAGGNAGGSTGLVVARPQITHGIAAGDVRSDGALIWARSDRPAQMVVETAATESFNNARTFRSQTLMTPETDGTGRLRVVGLEPGQDIFYRVRLEDPDTGVMSEALTGTFRTAPTTAQDIRLHWSGDVAGQGWGINPDLGGMKGWATMAARQPDLFIHSGDTVYSDGVIKETVTLSDGRTWRNTTSEAKSKVAETLDEFRGQFAYNLTDENYRAFNASVAQMVQWDDHEVSNNWYPGEILDSDEYQVKDTNILVPRAWQAFHEWQPLDEKLAVDGRIYRKMSYGPLLDIFILDMRSYKDRNDQNNPQTTGRGEILGRAQKDWLISEVNASTATWKIIANDLPLGIIVPDGESGDQEGIANGIGGAPQRRESELAEVLSGIKNVANVVWLTADVHYTAAHHYSPDRATFQNFSPFWEFVSGPLHAGAFGPNEMDPTFGPKVEYIHAPGKDNQNASPLEDFQHFGEVDIAGDTGAMTVRLITTQGTELWSKTLEPTR